jgi:hypothetical protein
MTKEDVHQIPTIEEDEEEEVVMEDGVDEDEDSEMGEDMDFSELLYNVLTTDEDESIANVLRGIRDGVDKQNKILYKIVTLLEKNSAPK